MHIYIEIFSVLKYNHLIVHLYKVKRWLVLRGLQPNNSSCHVCRKASNDCTLASVGMDSSFLYVRSFYSTGTVVVQYTSTCCFRVALRSNNNTMGLVAELGIVRSSCVVRGRCTVGSRFAEASRLSHGDTLS